MNAGGLPLSAPVENRTVGQKRRPEGFRRRPAAVLPATLPAWAPALLVGLVLTSPAWTPILLPDLNVFRLFDAESHVFRTFLLREMIAGGDWYPRWTPVHYGGFGYPTFTFYAPLLNYVMLLLAWLPPVGGLPGAFRLAGAGASLVLLVGAFTLSWRIRRHGPAALLCMAMVAYAPVVLSIALLQAGSPPQVLGLGLTGWLLCCCLGLWQAVAAGRPSGAWWWATVAVSALLLVSHNVSAAIAPALVAGWLGVCWLHAPHRRAPWRVAAAGATGATLAAFAWIPALLHAPEVQLERLHVGMNHYRNWFIAWPGNHPEVWGAPERSPWTSGWPFDLHLIYPVSMYGPPKASLWQTVTVGAGIATLVVILVTAAVSRRRRSATPAASPPAAAPDGRAQRLGRLALAFGLVVALAGYAMCFDWALPLWQRYPAIRSIQAPHRLLGWVAYGAALVGAGVLAHWLRPGRRAWLVATLLSVGIALVGTAGRSLPLQPGGSTAVDGAAVLNRQLTFAAFNASSAEYLPRTANFDAWHEGEVREFFLYERMFPEASWLAGRLLVWNGDVAVRGASGGALWTVVDAEVSGDAPGTLAFHQLSFPGWRAWIDGRAVPVGTTPWIAEQAVQPGFILVDVPPGRHSVAIRFGSSLPVIAAALLSLGAWLAVAVRLSRRPAHPRGAARAWRLAGTLAISLGVLVAAIRLLQPLWPPAGSPTPIAPAGTAGEFARAPSGAPPVAPVAVTATAGPLLIRSIADAVLDGSAIVRSPSGPTLGGDRFVDLRFVGIQAGDRPLRDAGPRRRRWLYMHPQSDVSVDIAVPSGAYVQTSMAIDPAAWTAPLGDGVEFLITLTPLPATAGAPAGSAASGAPGAEVVLRRAWLNPRARGEDRRWLDAVLDLGPWAGQRVRLTLRTEGRQDPANDWAGWGEPAVVRLDPLTAARLARSSDAIARVSGRP